MTDCFADATASITDATSRVDGFARLSKRANTQGLDLSSAAPGYDVHFTGARGTVLDFALRDSLVPALTLIDIVYRGYKYAQQVVAYSTRAERVEAFFDARKTIRSSSSCAQEAVTVPRITKLRLPGSNANV